MLNKNNFDSKNRFSLRKLTIGLVTVLLGTTFYLANGQVAHAASESNETLNHVEPETTVSHLEVQDAQNSNAPSQVSEPNVNTEVKDASGKIIRVSSTAYEMTAKQDDVNVKTEITNIPVTVKELSFSFSPVGEDKNFKINADGINVSGWTTTIENKDTIKAVRQDGNVSTTFSLNLPLLAIKESDNPVSVKLSVSADNQKISEEPILYAKVNKPVDHVKHGEIVKGFFMKTTNVETEKGYGISFPTDLNDNQTILQWGIYFNYGIGGYPQLHLDPLSNAKFNLIFGGQQTLIPSSIKVFKVPAKYIHDADGNRNDINSYYDEIIGGGQDSDFEDFLKDNISATNTNEISVNKEGLFNPGGNDDYSHYAYFFQIDTVLPKNETIPSAGDTLTYEQFEGTGDQIDKRGVVTPAGVITGGGDQREISKSVSYTVNYIYKNGSLKSDRPFDTKTKSITLKSDNNGQTWKNNNQLVTSLSETVPAKSNEANEKYAVDSSGITISENGNDVLSNAFKLNDNNINFNIPATTYVITVPYYTTQHADVRFYDDTNKKDINSIPGIQLIDITDANKEYKGLEDNYTKKDNNSVNTAIEFQSLDSTIKKLKDEGYSIEKVEGNNATYNAETGKFTFGNFDNDENKDQHFVIYLIKPTPPNEGGDKGGGTTPVPIPNTPKTPEVPGVPNTSNVPQNTPDIPSQEETHQVEIAKKKVDKNIIVKKQHHILLNKQGQNVRPHSVNEDEAKLPQTGEKNSILGLIGLALATAGSVIGLDASRRKKN